MTKYWIAEATKNKGAYRRSVQRRYGKSGFTKSGEIKESIKSKDARKKGKIGKQARLAQKLESFQKS